MKRLVQIIGMLALVVGLTFSVPAQKDDQKRPPKEKPPVRDPGVKTPKENRPPKEPKKPGMESYMV